MLCLGDNSLCGGYDGTTSYSEVYQYIAGGNSGCPALASSSSSSVLSSTTLKTSTVSSTSSTSSPTGTASKFTTIHFFDLEL